jgi:hypothetical protein
MGRGKQDAQAEDTAYRMASFLSVSPSDSMHTGCQKETGRKNQRLDAGHRK